MKVSEYEYIIYNYNYHDVEYCQTNKYRNESVDMPQVCLPTSSHHPLSGLCKHETAWFTQFAYYS